MDKLLKIYQDTQELMKHKDELLKYPDAFQLILEGLRKAAKDEDDDSNDGMSIVDDPNGDMGEDEADKWLKENSDKKEADPAKQEQAQRAYLSKWKQRENMSPKEKAAHEEFKKQGYSDREAERMLPGYRGKGYANHGVENSIVSDKYMGELKPLLKEWLENADKQEKLKADPESNTVKRQAGKLTEAHEKHTGDFTKDYANYLKSDELKGASPADRHKKVTAWKADWKANNPQHEEGLSNISQAQKDFAYDQQKAKQTATERHQHILNGGQSMPTEMSDQEALQHAGGSKSDEGYKGVSIHEDPSASFAKRNPQIHAAMQPEQLERKKAVDSAALTQGKVRTRKKVQE